MFKKSPTSLTPAVAFVLVISFLVLLAQIRLGYNAQSLRDSIDEQKNEVAKLKSAVGDIERRMRAQPIVFSQGMAGVDAPAVLTPTPVQILRVKPGASKGYLDSTETL